MRGVIALEFVGHQPTWFTALAFEETAKEAFCSLPIASALHQDINGIAILIDGPPQILVFPLDGDKHFVEVPRVAEPSLSLFEFSRIGRSKLLTPLANRFICDGDPTFGEEFFDFTKAEAEPMVEPHGMTDNFRGKPVTLVAGRLLFHAAQSVKPELN